MFDMQLHRTRAARLPRTAPEIATSPKAAAALDGQQNSRARPLRQDALSSAARHVEAARADLVALIREDQGATSADEFAALAAVVAVLHVAEKSLSPGEAAFMVGRTEPTIIAWCRKFGIGMKAGGRWIVDPLRLALLLLGGAA